MADSQRLQHDLQIWTRHATQDDMIGKDCHGRDRTSRIHLFVNSTCTTVSRSKSLKDGSAVQSAEEMSHMQENRSGSLSVKAPSQVCTSKDEDHDVQKHPVLNIHSDKSQTKERLKAGTKLKFRMFMKRNTAHSLHELRDRIQGLCTPSTSVQISS